MERAGVKLRVVVALRQEAGEARERFDCGKSGRVVERARGMRLDQLEIEAAEMFRKPRPPGDAQDR